MTGTSAFPGNPRIIPDTYVGHSNNASNLNWYDRSSIIKNTVPLATYETNMYHNGHLKDCIMTAKLGKLDPS